MLPTLKNSKLPILRIEVPPGYIVDVDWLDRAGIGRRNGRAYVQEGWLHRNARGVYRHPLSDYSSLGLDWETLLRSLQWFLNHRVHLGGYSALRIQGFQHYAFMGPPSRVWVYGLPLPSWTDRIPCNTKFVQRSLTLFGEDHELGMRSLPLREEWRLPEAWPLLQSDTERALLEMAAEVPHQIGYDYFDKAF